MIQRALQHRNDWSSLGFGQITVARSEWKGQVTLPKGGKVRYVPMTQRLISALRENRLRSRNRMLVQDDGEPMTMKTIQQAVQRAARRADVHDGVHILRHTCSHLAMKGAPARTIQQLAGHVDLATTQRYMHLQRALWRPRSASWMGKSLAR